MSEATEHVSKPAQKIVIDAEELAEALSTNNNVDGGFFLDLETGNMIMLSDGLVSGEDFDPDECEDGEEELHAWLASGRAIRIEPLPTHVFYEIMEDYVEDLPDGEAKMRLGDAISGKGAFRRFKDMLYNYPEIREEWFQFEATAKFKIAEEFLREQDVKAELKYPARFKPTK